MKAFSKQDGEYTVLKTSGFQQRKYLRFEGRIYFIE
jgi:hypothetical protein